MLTPWINYHHLYYFKVIAEEGSVSKAAEKLRLGQPTLSAQLKQFESTLGVELFERKHKKLILTEHGGVALQYAQNIFKMGSEMFEVLHDRVVPSRPKIHIGAIDSVPKQAIAQLVKASLKKANCQITLSEGKPEDLYRELAEHRIDLLVTNSLPTTNTTKGFFHRVVTRRPVAIFGSAKFKHLRKGFPQSISGQPIILPTYDSKLRFDFDIWAKSHEVALNIVVESQDIATKKSLAIFEIGLIPAATHSVTRQVLGGELVEIGTVENVFEELILVAAQRKLENPIAADLLKNFQV